MTKKYMTPNEAANYTGTSVSYLARCRSEGNREGKKPGPIYSKVGRIIRYKVEDLDKWLEGHRIEA